MRAETESEVMQQAAEHARTVHNLSEISEQAVVKIRSLISDEMAVPITSHRTRQSNVPHAGIAA